MGCGHVSIWCMEKGVVDLFILLGQVVFWVHVSVNPYIYVALSNWKVNPKQHRVELLGRLWSRISRIPYPQPQVPTCSSRKAWGVLYLFIDLTLLNVKRENNNTSYENPVKGISVFFLPLWKPEINALPSRRKKRSSQNRMYPQTFLGVPLRRWSLLNQ
jgi:hypothetical protein